MLLNKYPLHPDYRKISLLNFPASVSLLPAFNFCLPEINKQEHSTKSVRVYRKQINGYRGTRINLLIYEPYNLPENAPCLIYYHGGGFMFKASTHHFSTVRTYALKTGCKVIFPDYSTLPETAFPTPVEECYKTYIWAVKNAAILDINPKKIAVAGDSAGGNLAAAVTLMARDRHAPLPCFQMLIYPVLDRRMKTDSMKKYYDTPMWNSGLSMIMWKLYLRRGESGHMEYASPSEAKDLSGLPPAYIETAEFDCLHDEGILYAERLKESGNKVTLRNTKGTPHGYDCIPNAHITRTCMKLRILHLKKAFEEGENA